jgi:hypothetical protein
MPMNTNQQTIWTARLRMTDNLARLTAELNTHGQNKSDAPIGENRLYAQNPSMSEIACGC